MNSVYVPDFSEVTTDAAGDEVPWSLDRVTGDDDVSIEPFGGDDVAEVIGEWSDGAIYSHDNNFTLYFLNDGRYALVSACDWGTCSHCGGASRDVVFTTSAHLMYRMGLTDELRNNMPNLSRLIEAT